LLNSSDTTRVSLLPQVSPELLGETRPLQITTPDGGTTTGFFIYPKTPRLLPPPLVIYCRDTDFPGYPADLDFNPDAQALASLGMAVLDLGFSGIYRSRGSVLKSDSSGSPEHNAVDLIVASIEAAAACRPIDHRRVALVGQGFGGYLMLRALQRAPTRFRCAVTIDTPTDLVRWRNESAMRSIAMESSSVLGALDNARYRATQSVLAAPSRAPSAKRVDPRWAKFDQLFGTDMDRLAELSPINHTEVIVRPVFFLQDPENFNVVPSHASRMYAALKKANPGTEQWAPPEKFSQRAPLASVQVFTRIEEFSNLNLYTYKVDVGETEVVK
jgi:dipeptidyl aminopeptidase/acylaminoacyl peptidase